MDDSFNTELNFTQTATGSGEAASESRAEGIAPVFIKQLINSGETVFTMWGMRFGMVSCVAIVRSIEPSSTKITYSLEDHTGRIDGHYWLEDGDDADNLTPNIMLNNYAIVYGCIRAHGDKRTLMIFKLLPVNDPNAICTHGLEVLNARFKAEEFYKKSSDVYGNNDGGESAVSESNVSGLDSKQRAVFETIRVNGKNTQGLPRKELENKFSHINPKELKAILEFLIGEGHIYSSIDSDHFLITE